MQAVQLQSWLLDRLLAYAAKHSLLVELLTEKRTQLTSNQAEFFNRNIAEAGVMSLGLAQAGGGNLCYSILFGVATLKTSQSEVHQQCPDLISSCWLWHGVIVGVS